MKLVKGVLFFVGMLSLGLFVGYLIGNSSIGVRLDTLLDRIPFWLLIVQLIAANLLVLALHELGHLLMGLAQGNQFALFVVGPLRVWAENGRTRVGLNKNLQLFGGVAATVPRTETRLAERMAWIAAAGPLTSVAVTAVAGVIATLTARPALIFFFGLVSVSGLFNFLAVTIPSSTGNFPTDRARWQMLRRGGAEAERWTAVARLTSLALRPVRPRTWDASVVAQAVALPDGSIDHFNGRLYALLHYLDANRIEEAGAQLDALLANETAVPSIMRPSIFLEAAYFTARYRQDPAAARAWLARAPQSQLVEKQSRLRAEAAVLLAEGKADQARAVLETAVQLANKSPQTGAALAESVWLSEMQAALHHATAS